MGLLVETNFRTGFRLVESKNLRGNAVIEGLLATAEEKNGNGRYYKRSIWQREIGKYMQKVKENRAMGELDHPESSVVNLKNVSHNITDIWWNGDKVMGRLEILPTPSGNIVKALLESNIQIGVSSRGMGSVQQVGDILEVQDDFELLCWDIVSDPSNRGSWMSVVSLNESMNQNPYKYHKVNDIVREILSANQ